MKTLVSRIWKHLWTPPHGFVQGAFKGIVLRGVNHETCSRFYGVTDAQGHVEEPTVLVLAGLAATLHSGVHGGYDIGHLHALGAVQSGGYGGGGGGGYGGGHGVPIVKVGYVKKPYVSIG
ncbi:unnamed protein product, partial [Ixodes persulcatus]